MHKNIVRIGSTRVIWTRERWEWESFIGRIVGERKEHLLWYGLTSLNFEWEMHLWGWMVERGEFFVIRHDGGIVGGAWVTDVEDGCGKFHFAMLDNMPMDLVKVNTRLILERILLVGLDKRCHRGYKSLVGITPFEHLARLARMHGFGDYEKDETYFEGNPGYIVTMKLEN